jgi:hypothetical protein
MGRGVGVLDDVRDLVWDGREGVGLTLGPLREMEKGLDGTGAGCWLSGSEDGILVVRVGVRFVDFEVFECLTSKVVMERHSVAKSGTLSLIVTGG